MLFVRTIKEFLTALFTPKLTPLNSYWYLFDWPDQEAPVNQLVLFTGRVCEELLEGSEWIPVKC